MIASTNKIWSLIVFCALFSLTCCSDQASVVDTVIIIIIIIDFCADHDNILICYVETSFVY